ncbi:hypothetical protein [Pantoea sp. y20]
MDNNYFSAETLGFYPGSEEKPSDAVEVSPQVESFLREVIVWGASKFKVSKDSVQVEYPAELASYVIEYGAPKEFSSR